MGTEPTSLLLEEKEQSLRRILAGMGRMLVAYSGGIDSLFLATMAVEAVGRNALAVLARSPSLPAREFDEAVELARELGIPLSVVETDELENPEYAANPANRCYHCKAELFTHLTRLAKAERYPWICYGANMDDRGDWRPGLRAAGEFGVRAPLIEAGLGKAEIRELARARGIRAWDKPAMPCLSSRIPYGRPVTREVLGRIEEAEGWLRDRGFREVRVRDHHPVARIEVPPDRMAELLASPLREELVAAFRRAGYSYASLDLAALRSGNLNELVGARRGISP